MKIKFAIALLLTPLVDPLVLFILNNTFKMEGGDGVDAEFIDEQEITELKAKKAKDIKIEI